MSWLLLVSDPDSELLVSALLLSPLLLDVSCELLLESSSVLLPLLLLLFPGLLLPACVRWAIERRLSQEQIYCLLLFFVLLWRFLLLQTEFVE